MIIERTTILITLVIFFSKIFWICYSFFQFLLNLLFLSTWSANPGADQQTKTKPGAWVCWPSCASLEPLGGFIDPRRSGLPPRHAGLQTCLPSSVAMHAVDPSTQGMQPKRHVSAALPCPHQNQIWLFSPQPSFQC
jgi:hypothetical protein